MYTRCVFCSCSDRRGFLPSPSSYFLHSGDQIAMESEQINQTAPRERYDDKKDLVAESVNDIDQRHGEPRFGFLTYGTTTTIQVCVTSPLINPPNHVIPNPPFPLCCSVLASVSDPNIFLPISSLSLYQPSLVSQWDIILNSHNSLSFLIGVLMLYTSQLCDLFPRCLSETACRVIQAYMRQLQSLYDFLSSTKGFGMIYTINKISTRTLIVKSGTFLVIYVPNGTKVYSYVKRVEGSIPGSKITRRTYVLREN